MSTSYYSSSGPTTLTATKQPGPINSNGSGSCSTTSHAVSRSTELLSCARTALKIIKVEYQKKHPPHSVNNKTPPWYMSVDPSQLQLHPNTTLVNDTDESMLLQDGLSLLRTVQQELTKLKSLVRRRGHVNDPTHEIDLSTRHLQADTKELSQVIQTLLALPSKSKQHGRHLELVVAWLQNVASQQAASLKEILKLRGNVLADQAQRRKLLNPTGQVHKSHMNGSSGHMGTNVQQSLTGNGSQSTTSTPWDSPLFTMTSTATARAAPPPRPQAALQSAPAAAVGKPPVHNSTQESSATGVSRSHATAPPLYGNGGATTNTTTSTSPYYGGYGGSSGYNYGGSSGYGGGGGYGGTSVGMRQRKSGATNSNSSSQNNQDDNHDDMQTQLQLRQEARQTRARLEFARQTQGTLAGLTQLFGKMSTLIHSQGEVLERIEDDVEQAAVDVTAGQEEITRLQEFKKGNRPLILKVFGILIFFIIFMRLY